MFIIKNGRAYSTRPRASYPFATMQPGDSFILHPTMEAGTVASSAYKFGNRHGMKFSVKQAGNGKYYECRRLA